MDVRRTLISAAVTGVVVTGGFAVAGTANAATVTETRTRYATDDAYTSSARKSANFGDADKLVVGRYKRDTKVSYLKFDTGALPSGATVTEAELKLPLASRPVEAKLYLYRVTGSWSEDTITAARAPRMSTAIAAVKPDSTDIKVKFDVSRWVKKAGVYSFALKSASTSAVTRLRSVEYGTPGSGGPELRVTYTRTKTTAPTTPPTTEPTTPPTTAPTTEPITAPTTEPTTPGECVTGALLVPSCGVLWGAAAGGFTDTPRDQALKDWESLTGRTASIYHTYHKGDERFPTKAEIAMTRDPAKPRVLLLNWKIAYGSTWAKVAKGEQDKRIDAFAERVKATYPEKFFLALHHEPENDVVAKPGSGWEAKDYAAMYRHTIQRLRAKGVTNAVNVVAYMGNEKWMAQPWWKDIYPGDDVVDWIGLDSYVSVEKDYYHYGDFSDLLHREPKGGGTSWYNWAATAHPDKPIMVAEWGMYHRLQYPTDKSAAFDTVVPVLKAHPQVKAVVYFDTAADDEGDRNIAVNSTAGSLTAFRKVATDPLFNVTIKH